MDPSLNKIPPWRRQKWRNTQATPRSNQDSSTDIVKSIIDLLKDIDTHAIVTISTEQPKRDVSDTRLMPTMPMFPFSMPFLPMAFPPQVPKLKPTPKPVPMEPPFRVDPDKQYDELDVSIDSVDDLISLGSLYTENHRFSFDLKRLHSMLPTLERLRNVIGMDSVKRNIVHQVTYFLSGLGANEDMLHTVITGPPGVGKTMLGHIIGELYYKLGVVRGNGKKYTDPVTGKETDYVFKIAKRSDLIGEFLGHTAVKTQKVIDECQGGVLFIDEAYSLGNEEKRDSFSKECIDTINQNLTEKKRNFVCIIAGYPEALERCFFSVNEGLRRRFPFRYDIEPYEASQLADILALMVQDRGWTIKCSSLVEFMQENKESFPHFGGDIETFFFNVRVFHSMRTIAKQPRDKKTITTEDLRGGLELFLKAKSNKEEDKGYLSMFT
jgi:hypothetical protein